MKGVLTDKQENVLNCLKDYISENGFAPSIRELCVMTGLVSSSTVHFHLKTLEQKGYIMRRPESPRAIKIL